MDIVRIIILSMFALLCIAIGVVIGHVITARGMPEAEIQRVYKKPKKLHVHVLPQHSSLRRLG